MMGVIAPARQLLSKEKLLAHVLRGLEADLASKSQLQSECLEKQKDLDAQHATVAALATTTTTTEGAVVQPGVSVLPPSGASNREMTTTHVPFSQRASATLPWPSWTLLVENPSA